MNHASLRWRIVFATWASATLDLDITAGLITAGFVTTDSDVPSLSVMSLKMRK